MIYQRIIFLKILVIYLELSPSMATQVVRCQLAIYVKLLKSMIKIGYIILLYIKQNFYMFFAEKTCQSNRGWSTTDIWLGSIFNQLFGQRKQNFSWVSNYVFCSERYVHMLQEQFSFYWNILQLTHQMNFLLYKVFFFYDFQLLTMIFDM